MVAGADPPRNRRPRHSSAVWAVSGEIRIDEILLQDTMPRPKSHAVIINGAVRAVQATSQAGPIRLCPCLVLPSARNKAHSDMIAGKPVHSTHVVLNHVWDLILQSMRCIQEPRYDISWKIAFIEPESPWESSYCESFNSKPRDELLNGEIVYSLAEAKVVIEAWRRYCDTERPRSLLGYKPPATEAILWPSKPVGSLPPDAQAMAEKPIAH